MKSSSSISENELSQLKEKVLRALLNNEPLPGSNKRLTFPDLPFVLSQSDIYLVDNSVRNPISIEKIDKPVQVVSEDFLNQKTRKSGKVIYFQFQTKELGKDSLLLSIEAKVLSSSDQRKHDLTTMQIKFEKVGNDWKMTDEPTSLSA